MSGKPEEEGKTWMSAGIPGKDRTGKWRFSVVQLPMPVVPAPRTDEEYVDIDLTAFRWYFLHPLFANKPRPTLTIFMGYCSLSSFFFFWSTPTEILCRRYGFMTLARVGSGRASDGTVSIWDHKAKKRLRQYPKLPGPVAPVASNVFYILIHRLGGLPTI